MGSRELSCSLETNDIALTTGALQTMCLLTFYIFTKENTLRHARELCAVLKYEDFCKMGNPKGFLESNIYINFNYKLSGSSKLCCVS